MSNNKHVVTQAIETRYVGPSAKRPSRIIVKCHGKRMIVNYDDDYNEETSHSIAAAKLISAMGWGGNWIQGGNAKGDGYVFVNAANS